MIQVERLQTFVYHTGDYIDSVQDNPQVLVKEVSEIFSVDTPCEKVKGDMVGTTFSILTLEYKEKFIYFAKK